MQRLRPDIGAGTSAQPALTVASSESGCVQVLVNTHRIVCGQLAYI